MSVSPAAQKRIDRLQASFQAVLAEYERAKLRLDVARIEPFGMALKLLDVCIAIELGEFAERDAYHKVVVDPDRQLLARFYDLAAARDLLAHDRLAAAEAEGAAE